MAGRGGLDRDYVTLTNGGLKQEFPTLGRVSDLVSVLAVSFNTAGD